VLSDERIKLLIADRIRTARELARKTQKEAGQLIGVEQETWANYERGKRGVDAVTLVKMAQAFGLPVNFFTDPEFQITLRADGAPSKKGGSPGARARSKTKAASK
jgi:transcriptional regulator with XRE-family HTH domain